MSRTHFLVYILVMMLVITGIVYYQDSEVAQVVCIFPMAFGGSIAGLWIILSRLVRYNNRVEEELLEREKEQQRVKASDVPLFSQDISFKIEQPGQSGVVEEQDGLLLVDDYISVGDFHFAGDEIRWLGDRQGRGKVILDVEKDGLWYIITIEAGNSADNLVTALKEITPERVATARNLRKPNIRSDAIEGYVNQQNLQGQWQRREAISLTITPLWLVILANGRVFEAIRLEQILNVHCIEHPMALDESARLLAFETQTGNRHAYEITDQSFCERLATATREAVNQEPQRKKKANE